MYNKEDFIVDKLDNGTISSPLQLSKDLGDGVFNYVLDNERILLKSTLDYFEECRNNKKTLFLLKKWT